MSASYSQTIDQIKRSGVIAIIRGDYSQERILQIASTLVENGIDIIEVTMNTPPALQAIRAMRAAPALEACLIGAGTVRTAAQASAAIDAGSQFLVAPNLDLAAVRVAQAASIPITPGVFTATEAQTAFAAGCTIVKLFPSDIVGPRYLKALRAPLDDIHFIPTGGIGPYNLGDYVAAGAFAVGVGGSLIKGSDQSMTEIAERAQALRTAWNEAKKG